MAQKPIFREKSLDRINSPEQLNDYIKVAGPGIWSLLSAIIVLLLGVCAWGIFGHLDTTLNTAALIENDKAVVYIADKDISAIKEGMTVTVDGHNYTISEVNRQPVQAVKLQNEFLLYKGSFSEETWVYACVLSGEDPADDGVYDASIVTESIHPISFILN